MPRLLVLAVLFMPLVPSRATAQEWRRLYGNDYGSVDIKWSHGAPSFGVVTHRWSLRSTFRAPVRICFTFVRVTEGRQEQEESVAELQPGAEKRDPGWWTMSQSSQDPPIVEAKDCDLRSGSPPPRQPQPPSRAPVANPPTPRPSTLPSPVPPVQSRDAIQRELDRQLQRLGRQGSLGTSSSAATGAAINQGFDGLRDALNSYFERERANREAAYAEWERFQDQLERRQQQGSDLYFRTIETMPDSVAEFGAAPERARKFLDQMSQLPAKPLSLPGLNSQSRKAYEAKHKGCFESQYWEMFECVSAGDILLSAGERRLAESYYAKACEMDQGIGCAQLIRSVAARDEWLLARALVRTAMGCHGAEAQACLALYRPLWEAADAAPQPAPATAPLRGVAVPGTEWRALQVRLHEGPAAGVPWDQQRYLTRFQFAELRYLYTGLVLEGRAGAPLQAAVRCTTTGPSGVFSSDMQLQPDPSWSSYWVTAPRLGWPEPGHWMLGSYRVSCATQGTVLAETSFEITQRVPGTEWEATRLRFFEGPAEGVPFDQQRLTTAFTRGEVRYIFPRLELTGRAGAPMATEIRCRISGPFGDIDSAIQPRPDPSWTNLSIYGSGVGWAEPGHWPIGVYRTSCETGGVVLAVGSFGVAQPVPGTEWQVANIRTYAGPDDGVAYGQRVYRADFSRAELRRLYVELEFYGRAGTPLSGAVECTITGPDTPGRVGMQLRPDPSWDTYVMPSNGWGWTDAGHWLPGEYAVSCSMGQVQLASRTFRVVAP